MSDSQGQPAAEGGITSYLRTGPGVVFNLYAIFAAFTTYFCMYAFRKPFAAADYADYAEVSFLGSALSFKIAAAISQLLGYASS